MNIKKASETIKYTIQEKLAFEYSQFFELAKDMQQIGEKCLEQSQKIKEMGLAFQDQMLETENDTKSIDQCIKNILKSQDHNEIFKYSTELSKYLIFNEQDVIVDNEMKHYTYKMQNYKNTTQKLIENLNASIISKFEELNSDLKTFDFGFQKSTFDKSEQVQELVKGSEFQGQELGYQRIYSTLSFQKGYQEVKFTFKEMENMSHRCFVVGIRKNSSKDSQFNIFDIMYKKKDIARHCLHCSQNVNMDQIEINRNQKHQNGATNKGINQQDLLLIKEGKIIMDVNNGIFEIHDISMSKIYKLQKNVFKQVDDSWRIYFQFEGGYHVKIQETYNINEYEKMKKIQIN